MGGYNSSFGFSGLISGLDSNTLITQLMALSRQPVTRLENKIKELEGQQTTIRDIRTRLLTLFHSAQKFTFNSVFDQNKATSSDEEKMTAQISGTTAPAAGSYKVEVLQLATATVAQSSGFISTLSDTAATLENAGFSTDPTSGFFTINGEQITVDVATDTIQDVMDRITASAAGVTAMFDDWSEKVVLMNTDPTSTDIILLGTEDDTSNFLDIAHLRNANQSGTPTTVESSTNLGVASLSQNLTDITFAGGAVAAGTFKINGITFTIDDPATTTLSDIITDINTSEAGATASFDVTTNTLRVVSDTLGSRTVNFTDGTSGFLTAVNLDTATQTAGKETQIKLNDGSVLYRNTNSPADVISGVTLNLLNLGTSYITVAKDYDGIITDIKDFVTSYNDTIEKITEDTKQGGELENDGSIRIIMSYLQQQIFSLPTTNSADYQSLLNIGISTGSSFSKDALSEIEVDDEELRGALEDNIEAVESIFTNSTADGIADRFEAYLRDITSTTSFLSSRAADGGTIDSQIDSINSRIENMEYRLDMQEQRLRNQFNQLEVAMSNMQSTSQYLQQHLSALNAQ